MSIDNIAKSPTPTELVETINKMIEQLNVTKGLAIGDFVMSMRTDVPEGRIRPDGTEYPAAFNQDLWDNYITTGKLPTCTYAQWQALYSQYGNVGIIGVDAVNKKWKAPLIADGTFVAMALNGTIGEFFEAALPNIKANVGSLTTGALSTGTVDFVTTGAFSSDRGGFAHNGAVSNIPNAIHNLRLDVSKYNGVYKDGNNTYPNHIRYPLLMVIGNTSVMASEIQYSEFSGALSLKMNADFSNINPSAKGLSASWGLPDYSGAISANGTYGSYANAFNAPFDGILMYYAFITTKASSIYVNNQKIASVFGDNYGYGSGLPMTILLSKNDKFHMDGSINTGAALGGSFMPFKGGL